MAALVESVGCVKGLGAMTSLQAVDLLVQKGGVSLGRAYQLVAYAHAIRVLGWGATGLKTKGRWQAEKDFRAAGIDPKMVEFSGVERVGVGAAAGALFAAGTVIGDKLYDAAAGSDKKDA
jgi:hypothetical protein